MAIRNYFCAASLPSAKEGVLHEEMQKWPLLTKQAITESKTLYPQNFILRMYFMLSVVGLEFIHSRWNSCEEQLMQICTFKNRIDSVLQFIKGCLIFIMSITGQRSCAHSQWSKYRHPAAQFDKKCSSPILSSKFSTNSTFGFPSYPMTSQQ